MAFKKADKLIFYIPDLCHCGCGTILWHRGQRYVSGHDSKHHPYWKGIIRPASVGEKISIANKGRVVWNKGKKGCQIAWNKGIPVPEEQKERQRKKLIGRPSGRKGIPHSEETKLKTTGDKHYNWQGGISFIPYCRRFNKELKKSVKERDNYICQLCGATDKKLAVHHVHYDKENCYPDLITLCISDNIKANYNRKYYEELFMNKLNDREFLFWTLSLYKEKTV